MIKSLSDLCFWLILILVSVISGAYLTVLTFVSVGFSIKLVMLEKKEVISGSYLTMLAFMSVGFSIDF